MNRLFPLLFLFFSCSSDHIELQDLDSKYISLEIKDGELNLSHVDDFGVRSIVLPRKDKFQQFIMVDDEGLIKEIQNVTTIENNEIINTWVKLDKQGNPDLPESYFYSTYLTKDDSLIYIVCTLERVLLEKGKYYVVTGDFGDSFELNTNAKIDTILFDDQFEAILPVSSWLIGENQKKFLIVEESKNSNGFLQRKTTYVNKKFVVEPPN